VCHRMNDVLKSYISSLCDEFAHFGEFVKKEMADANVARYGRKVREKGMLNSFSKVYLGKMGVGPEVSSALGEFLNAPPEHYMKLYKLFKAEKERRKGIV
jgi:hypothetical protein